jgi:hypothetical protein
MKRDASQAMNLPKTEVAFHIEKISTVGAVKRRQLSQEMNDTEVAKRTVTVGCAPDDAESKQGVGRPAKRQATGKKVPVPVAVPALTEAVSQAAQKSQQMHLQQPRQSQIPQMQHFFSTATAKPNHANSFPAMSASNSSSEAIKRTYSMASMMNTVAYPVTMIPQQKSMPNINSTSVGTPYLVNLSLPSCSSMNAMGAMDAMDHTNPLKRTSSSLSDSSSTSSSASLPQSRIPIATQKSVGAPQQPQLTPQPQSQPQQPKTKKGKQRNQRIMVPPQAPLPGSSSSSSLSTVGSSTISSDSQPSSTMNAVSTPSLYPSSSIDSVSPALNYSNDGSVRRQSPASSISSASSSASNANMKFTPEQVNRLANHVNCQNNYGHQIINMNTNMRLPSPSPSLSSILKTPSFAAQQLKMVNSNLQQQPQQQQQQHPSHLPKASLATQKVPQHQQRRIQQPTPPQQVSPLYHGNSNGGVSGMAQSGNYNLSNNKIPSTPTIPNITQLLAMKGAAPHNISGPLNSNLGGSSVGCGLNAGANAGLNSNNAGNAVNINQQMWNNILFNLAPTSATTPQAVIAATTSTTNVAAPSIAARNVNVKLNPSAITGNQMGFSNAFGLQGLKFPMNSNMGMGINMGMGMNIGMGAMSSIPTGIYYANNPLKRNSEEEVLHHTKRNKQ